MSRASAFRRVSEQRAGVWRKLKAVDCICGAQLASEVKSENDDVIGRYFVGRGWRVGRSIGAHTCPTCAAHPSQARQPQEPEAMEAEKPRTPTREDRRKINDALDAHYLPDRGCYQKAFSDQSLSEKLKVPRAWVAEERDRLFGPDVNEATAQNSAELLRLEQRAQKVEEDALRTAAEAEAIKRDVATMRGKLVRAA